VDNLTLYTPRARLHSDALTPDKHFSVEKIKERFDINEGTPFLSTEQGGFLDHHPTFTGLPFERSVTRWILAGRTAD
jgi:hypothetical protein